MKAYYMPTLFNVGHITWTFSGRKSIRGSFAVIIDWMTEGSFYKYLSKFSQIRKMQRLKTRLQNLDSFKQIHHHKLQSRSEQIWRCIWSLVLWCAAGGLCGYSQETGRLSSVCVLPFCCHTKLAFISLPGKSVNQLIPYKKSPSVYSKLD